MARSDPRVSVVTGSARGLGHAAAQRLAQRGDRVHVVWRSSDERVPELEAEFPGRVHRADLTQPAEVERLVSAVLALDGRVDALVHAVGEYIWGPLADATPADLRRMLASNVETSFAVSVAFRAALRAARGSLVFFGCAGLDGLGARRETAVYAAAKSALVVFARSLALEEAPHGVRVNLVSPGLVPHEAASSDTRAPEKLARLPFGRPGTPAEVAAAVTFLTSDEASYTTGCDLTVAGGWML